MVSVRLRVRVRLTDGGPLRWRTGTGLLHTYLELDNLT